MGATGKKLDMGKSCLRFGRLDDLSLEVLGEAIARTSVDDFIAAYERSRHRAPVRHGAGRAATDPRRSPIAPPRRDVLSL